MLDWLKDWLNQCVQWLQDVLLYIPKWVVHEVLTAVSDLISALPVPDWMQNAAGYMSGIPSSVVWFLTLVHFKFGVTVILAALVLRTTIKFIPFVGR